MLRNCLSVEDSLVFSDHVRVSANQSLGFLVWAKLDVDLCTYNVSNSLNHQTHLIRWFIQIEIELLWIHKIPLFVVDMRIIVSSTILIIAGIPLVLVELLVSLRWLGHQSLEILMELVESHFTHTLVLPGPDVDLSSSCLLLASYEDEVPLLGLMGSHLLLQGVTGQINFDIVPKSVQVKINTLAVVKELLREWNYDGLSGRDEKGPLAGSVLDQHGHKALD